MRRVKSPRDVFFNLSMSAPQPPPSQLLAQETKIGPGELPRTFVSTGVGNKLSRWFVIKQTKCLFNEAVCLKTGYIDVI